MKYYLLRWLGRYTLMGIYDEKATAKMITEDLRLFATDK